jgi:transcriptional regulator with GAF, ATPase, and Fis domain
VEHRIVAVTGSAAGAVFRLGDDEFTIGRDSGCGLSVNDAAVSRRHCVISRHEDVFKLLDLDSLNGTFVNGAPVHEEPLRHGDSITVGHTMLLFLSDTEVDADTLFADDQDSPLLNTVKLPRHTVWGERDSDNVGRMARDLNALTKISTTLNSLRDPRKLQCELLQLIFEVVPAQRGAIVLMNGPQAEPSSVRAWDRDGLEGESLEMNRGVIRDALWQGSAVVAQPDSASDPGQSSGWKLCVPLIAVDRTLGAVYLEGGPAAPFSEDHVAFLGTVAGVAAVALENSLALESLRSENRRLAHEIRSEQSLIGDSRRMKEVMQFVAKVAGSDSTVLIRGESGTGKELVARAVHTNSPRANKPFVAINCAAITETLLESELFGHEKGAFTGAVTQKIGKLQAAEGGTVFLDEIGELAPALQAKLLRALQEREFERVGGTRPIAINVRFTAATNKDLEAAIKAGTFRRDLFYRLNVVSITLPPLREHREDIPLLTSYFAARYSEKCRRPVKGVSAPAREILMNYSWPGNVRELENAIERAVVLGSSDVIIPEDLPESILDATAGTSAGTDSRYHAAITHLKRELVVDAIRTAQGNITEAARLLGIHANYLHRLLHSLNLREQVDWDQRKVS